MNVEQAKNNIQQKGVGEYIYIYIYDETITGYLRYLWMFEQSIGACLPECTTPRRVRDPDHKLLVRCTSIAVIQRSELNPALCNGIGQACVSTMKECVHYVYKIRTIC
jgi:hypothetical protein